MENRKKQTTKSAKCGGCKSGRRRKKMTPDGEQEEKEVEILLPNTTIVTHCILKNDSQRFVRCFEDDEDAFKDTVAELINQRGEDGKSPLDLAATLGRGDISKELIQRGADVLAVNCQGYCAMHHAAAWGKLGVLKVLVEALSDLQQKNIHGERPRETALRYNKTECVDFLDWAEAKVDLQNFIKTTQETLADGEKVQGRLTKDDKNIITNTCKEKAEWVERTTDATTKDFITQKMALEEVINPIMQKLNEPVESPQKGAKKGK
ncbi:Hypothetical predicted protein [Mytilus galloprovincialis]|uniref:Ankyrin repeat domain-containing protein 45 n=1 Tax=Mytilus galloprovincialis TaxID=29158 RepID=A0A8B6HED1_MYTGA|nr:Hypothetical predicted protein [Mytilus galloprovincialis]